jgi:hypothetical protein
MWASAAGRPPTGALIWCGVSAPVIQGILTGLGIVVSALVLFPYESIRSLDGPRYRYAQATTYARWARWIGWVLGPLALLSLAGYIVLYVAARGKFCDASLTPLERKWIVLWAAATVVTLVLAAISAVMRRAVRRRQEK